MRKILAATAVALLLGTAVAQASTTFYTDPGSLLVKWYNIGMEKTIGDRMSLGTNVEFFQNSEWTVADLNLNFRFYLKSNDGGPYLQGTVMELGEMRNITGATTFETSFQVGAGYKWVDGLGITSDVRIWSPIENPAAHIGVWIGITR